MARPTGIFKRQPDFLFTDDRKAAWAQYEKFSKADWCDLYFDLYRQCFGEQEEGDVIMQDAKSRLEIIILSRRQDNGK